MSQKRWLLILGAIVLSCAAAYQLGSKTKEAVPSAPREYEIDGLVVAASSLDLGEVWEDKDFIWVLPIQNRTDRIIKISDFSLSCGCMEAAEKSLTIPAHATERLTLKLDLNRRAGYEIGRATRPFVGEVTPIRTGSTRRERVRPWQLHGTVRSRVTLNYSALDFGELTAPGQKPVTRHVMATAHVPTPRLVAGVDPDVLSVRIEPHPELANTFDVAVTLNSSLSPRHFKTKVELRLLTPDGETLPGVTLPVEGDVRPGVGLFPAVLAFGGRQVGDSAEADVVLRAPAGVEAEIEKAESDVPHVSAESIRVDNTLAGRAWRVSWKVAKEGHQSHTVYFSIRKADKSVEKIGLEVSCTGLATRDE